MAEEQAGLSFEDLFNRNLDELLADRGLRHSDLLGLLEAASYTPDTPATVLLNDAVAMAAVLGVSPWQLLLPAEGETVDITPDMPVDERRASLWLRALAPLRDEDYTEFHRAAPLEDLDADRVAEHWVRAERLRAAGLALAINDAVDNGDLEAAKMLTELATRLLDQPTLERADGRVPRPAVGAELQAAVDRATRFRRQSVQRQPNR